jgi:hypothetical protein
MWSMRRRMADVVDEMADGGCASLMCVMEAVLMVVLVDVGG